MLNRLKRSLGKQCSFLSFSVDKAKTDDGWITVDCIKAVMLNDFGKKDTVVIALEKKPVEMTADDYHKIFYLLNSRTYEIEENGGN